MSNSSVKVSELERLQKMAMAMKTPSAICETTPDKMTADEMVERLTDHMNNLDEMYTNEPAYIRSVLNLVKHTVENHLMRRVGFGSDEPEDEQRVYQDPEQNAFFLQVCDRLIEAVCSRIQFRLSFDDAFSSDHFIRDVNNQVDLFRKRYTPDSIAWIDHVLGIEIHELVVSLQNGMSKIGAVHRRHGHDGLDASLGEILKMGEEIQEEHAPEAEHEAEREAESEDESEDEDDDEDAELRYERWFAELYGEEEEEEDQYMPEGQLCW